ncbi:MAG: 16S rRNA (adenine(1518)-N(6)/adenine(1519)-N(6))-dimethyltransferase RsmA [Cytophagaceae bacterium]|jgi:16S rRNA (adenine1518-N6/adenine1519-N6)-dimethyltransferase|nr:16S rRNA (adenine(1518)-N(6)/adenine(1519)-N(6))-dimethyltransferase RsmA [Cytophagaceae bacterium]
MKKVKAKKYLGQHFLNDTGIARTIVESLQTPPHKVIEVGSGMGVLTRYLLQRDDLDVRFVEIDHESILYLLEHYPETGRHLIEKDFLKIRIEDIFKGQCSIIGNFPYNISSQIFFKTFDNRHLVTSLVGMVQREVGRRIASPHGSKEYGILSVLLQSFYDIEYLFTVDEHVFTPPPKVKSGVIRMTRNSVQQLTCNEKLFIKTVKAAFNQRRKTLRNSLQKLPFNLEAVKHLPVFGLRPEQLSVSGFQELTLLIEEHIVESEEPRIES